MYFQIQKQREEQRETQETSKVSTSGRRKIPKGKCKMQELIMAKYNCKYVGRDKQTLSY